MVVAVLNALAHGHAGQIPDAAPAGVEERVLVHRQNEQASVGQVDVGGGSSWAHTWQHRRTPWRPTWFELLRMQSICFIASAWKASDDMRRSLVGSRVRERAIVLKAGGK